MKRIIAVFVLLITAPVVAQKAQDYISYHKKINRAEILFFMEEKTDSSLTVYNEVFNSYEFIFLKDLLNAAQIACFNKKPYAKYLKRGFEFGLKLEHLKNYPLFKDELQQLKNNKELRRAYVANRKKYLQNIDFEYLNWIYELYIQDQFDKNKENYESIMKLTLRKLRDKIVRKGFPGERIIGINDSTIFSEIGKPKLDLKEKKKRYDGELSYINTNDESLSATQVFVLLVHHRCSYSKMKKILWEEMKKGNIHPRDIGMVYDNVFRFSERWNFPSYCERPGNHIYFRLNFGVYYPEKTKKNISETNSLRKAFYIVPLGVDIRKKEYEKKFGFVLFSGFWGCR